MMIQDRKISQILLLFVLVMNTFLVTGSPKAIAFNKVYASFIPDSSEKKFNYYYAIAGQNNLSVTSMSPTEAIIAIHGYPHDVNDTLNTIYQAALLGNKNNIVLVAPIFFVTQDAAKLCAKTLPLPNTDDIQWTCDSWLSGGIATNSNISSFQALDSLIEDIHKQWSTINKITIVGFSAGAQMTQHYIGFSANTFSQSDIHYVIADPGTWLYFDYFADRYPYTDSFIKESKDDIIKNCLTVNNWKYGLHNIPSHLATGALTAKVQYQKAKISYLVGALDNGNLPGAQYKILDKSCAANAQGGDSRLEREKVYMAYLQAEFKLSPIFKIVPNCAHDVNCVLTSQQAIDILFNPEN